MTLLTLVRHASTKLNEKRLLQGQSNPGLSELGIAQAQRMGLRAAKHDLAAVYTSPSQRCIETASMICKYLEVEFILTPLLQERDYGPFEGLTRDELLDRRKKLGLSNFDPTQNWDGVNEVESDAHIFGRVLPLFQSIIDEYPTGHLLLITHAGVMKAVLHQILRIPNQANACFKYPNACSLTLRAIEDYWHVIELCPSPSDQSGGI